jgi:hypothetical protein
MRSRTPFGLAPLFSGQKPFKPANTYIKATFVFSGTNVFKTAIRMRMTGACATTLL